MPPRAPLTLGVRPALDNDRAAIRGLLDAAGLLDVSGLDAVATLDGFHVAIQAGKVVACARLRALGPDAAELASVAVAAAWRGRRIGATLVAALLGQAPPVVYALAVSPGFFEAVGFRPMDAAPRELHERAAGACASRAFVPMVWRRA